MERAGRGKGNEEETQQTAEQRETQKRRGRNECLGVAIMADI